jgi:chaperone required for assembly of F1-ATPase
MTTTRPKRFYATVTIEPRPNGFAILLDNKPIRTPGGNALLLPARNLAEAIAAEWQAQREYIDAQTMPILRLVNTALERIPQTRAGVIAQLLEYGRHDLLCYRAEAPESLVRRQAEQWQPLLDWISATYRITLLSTAGIAAIVQSPESIAALETQLTALDDFALAGVSAATALTGSIVLALALFSGRLEASAAFRLASLEETFQAEHWGVDAEAEARLQRIAQELADVAEFLRLVCDRPR